MNTGRLVMVSEFTEPILVPVGGSGRQARLEMRVRVFYDAAELRWAPGPEPEPVCWHPNNQSFSRHDPCEHIKAFLREQRA